MDTLETELHASIFTRSEPLTDIGEHRLHSGLAAVSHRCSDATIVHATVDALKCGSCLAVI